MASHLFINGNVRVSTILTLCSFFVAALICRDIRAGLLGAWAWLLGFESAFGLVSYGFGRGEFGLIIPVFFAIIGPAAAWRLGVRPSPALLAAALLILAGWAAAGLHINYHTHGTFSSPAEAFNEGSKTVWAAAYLWPLWRRRLRVGTPPAAVST